jgi:hypothetical protein
MGQYEPVRRRVRTASSGSRNAPRRGSALVFEPLEFEDEDAHEPGLAEEAVQDGPGKATVGD